MTINIKLNKVNDTLVHNRLYSPIKTSIQPIKISNSTESFVSYQTNIPVASTDQLDNINNN